MNDHPPSPAAVDEHVRLSIAGMSCAGCVSAVASASGAPRLIGDLFHILPPLAGGGRLFWLIVCVATLGAIVYSAGPIYLAAWKAFRVHNANMVTLIALGTGAAWVYSMAVVLFPDAVPSLAQHAYFEAAAVIIALDNI